MIYFWCYLGAYPETVYLPLNVEFNKKVFELFYVFVIEDVKFF